MNQEYKGIKDKRGSTRAAEIRCAVDKMHKAASKEVEARKRADKRNLLIQLTVNEPLDLVYGI